MTKTCPLLVGQAVRWCGWYSVLEEDNPEDGCVWVRTFWGGRFPVSRLDLLPTFPNEEWEDLPCTPQVSLLESPGLEGDVMFNVYRQSDGEVMESEFHSEEEAEAWAQENLPEQAPEKWWYVDREVH